MKLGQTRIFAGFTLALVLLSSALLNAYERPLWRIGNFNKSGGEFRDQNINYADPASDPVYVVGTSHDEDWYRFQPGPANGMTGSRLHPFTIKFNLDEAPRGAYRLHVAMLYETPRLSFLKLSVNGRSGFFYFHPKLDFHAGDWEGTFVPQTSADEKSIAIPSTWLHRGENAFVLTAMDDPATSQTSLGAIAPGHTGLVYDALEFTQDADAAAHEQFSALIEPTIFYRSHQGSLFEIVDVYTENGNIPQSHSVELQVQGKKFEKPIHSDNQFGEQRFEFEVPVWEAAVSAQVRMGGQSSKTLTIEPAKKWTVAIIPHEHLDIGFTDYPAKVAELHSQSIDAAMGLVSATPDFRWTLDGSWVARQYLNTRPPELQKQFLDHVRSGSIVVPPEFANLHTGNASWEGLARSFYDQHALAAEFKLPTADAAQIVDVPSYSWAYASLLHDAGIKYFVAASNGWRAPITMLGRWNEKSPFYWEGPDGGRVLMWYSRAYLQAHALFGSPWRMESVLSSLPVFLQAYTRPDYTANTAIIFGTQLENTTLAKEQSEIAGAFNREYAWPKLQFSTVHAAMERIEKEWKGTIPVYRGDFGPYWEDGYGSDAKSTAIHRSNQHRIATAEILGAAISAIDPNVHPDASMLADAWHNELIYDEHTWTFVGATTQPEHHQSEDQIALKRAREVRAQDDISESIQRSWAQLEALVSTKENSIAVFNSLNWTRSGLVETDLPEGSKLIDPSTGSDVPLEILWKGKGISLPGFGPGNVRVRFLATNIPAIGYKTFTIANAATAQTDRTLNGNVFENDFYRLTIDAGAGAVSSIYDKKLDRELVDSSSPFKFGAYLYVSGGDDYPKNSLYRFGAALKPPTLSIHPAQDGHLLSAKETPLGIEIKLTSTTEHTPSIETEIFLPSSEKQILLTFRVKKDRVLTRESAYIAFPFAVNDPHFTYGSQAGWVNPAKDELPGGSREWYLPTTWASASNTSTSVAVVALDAPLMTFGDIMRGAWPEEFHPKSSTIYSWLMNNYWGTNFPAWQGGEFTFRYAITSEAQLEPASLTRFGLNALTPLEADDVGASSVPGALPDRQAGLLQISDPNLNLLTWKIAEDGDGSIVRLQENFGKATNAVIESRYLAVQRAWLCNLLEDKQSELAVENGSVHVQIQPFQVLTLRLQTRPREGSK